MPRTLPTCIFGDDIPVRSIGAGVIVYNSKTKKVLLVKDKALDYWGFPKGHVDRTDKDAKHAAVRELAEETGIRIPTSKLSPNFYAKTFAEDIYGGRLRQRIVHFYEAIVTTTPRVKLQKSELSDYTWATLTKAHELLQNEFQYPILMEIMKKEKFE